ncbi:prominin-like protein [Drosophila guanche]|uniref:Blast:Prominin-like protein n=1 Tax=Drosophila guanche TaxID=7266 RepID=A0A3B0J1P6_DROGU|nr:prominin-like protein [Drosophila guanche]SPP72812.1 blast:Prominin-like protein [Drosophila guanche]
MYSSESCISTGKGKSDSMAPPSHRKSTSKARTHRHFAPRAVRCSHALKVILLLLSLTLPIIIREAATAETEESASGTNSRAEADTVWREGYVGDGTTHEQLGQRHWPPVKFTQYSGYANYSRDLTSTHKALNPLYKMMHFIFRMFISDMPPGYVTLTDNNKLALGPKVRQHDWAALLHSYWFLLLIVIFLLTFIIVIPFIGVCYCCFCCCLRCKQYSRSKKRPWRLVCGICLALMVLFLIFGLIVAFIANKFLDRAFEDTKMTMKRSSEDTCAFLKEVADHIYHLMVYNYQEMEAHLDEHLNNAHNHIFLDLGDTSESNALAEMERIFRNMPKAYTLMVQVDALEKEIILLGSQLRDGLRGQKRNLIYAAYALCHLPKCYKWNRENGVMLYGTARCLHMDKVPNTTTYSEAIKKIIEDEFYKIPLNGMLRLNKIKQMILKQMRLVVPPILRSIRRGRIMMLDEATGLRDMIDSLISDIHLNTLRTTKTFEDVYEKFGHDRRAINIVICVLLFAIVVVLTSALICGFFGPKRTMPGPYKPCSKGMAASCLLIAIILIFCAFSFITLVCLFYMMIGLITYSTACASLRDDSSLNIFRQLDPVIDLSRYKTRNMEETATLSASNAIRACQADESIFDLLKETKIYNIKDLLKMEIFLDGSEEIPVFTDDLSMLYLFTEEEKLELNEMRDSNLSSYHSAMYSDVLCTKYTHKEMELMRDETEKFGIELNVRHWESMPACLAYYMSFSDLKRYNEYLLIPMRKDVVKLLTIVKEIDKLILYDNNNFNKGFKILMDATQRSENFIRSKGEDYINNLARNLTLSVNEQLQEYINRLIYEANTNVGHCQPLAYIYHQGVSLLCARLVDPINAFWLATLFCCLLLLPILPVAHCLMCMYLKIYPSPIVAQLAVAEAARCPVCIGPPVRSAWMKANRGRTGHTLPEELDRPIQVVAVRDEAMPSSKRKRE